jgi:thioredoxin-related protein
MKRLLAHPKVSTVLSDFSCYRRNYKTTKKAIRKKYRIKTAPMIVVFDATGKVIYRTTSFKTKPEHLVAMLKKLVKKSEKNLKKFQKKREKDEEKAAKKAEKENA